MEEHRFMSDEVLTVGDNGYTTTYLNPIEQNQDSSPNHAKAQAFHDNVISLVEEDFNDNRGDVRNAAIYTLPRDGNKNEATELKTKNTYTLVPDDEIDHDWIAKDRGTTYLNRSDVSNKKVKVNGDDPAPLRPAA
ncbi:MAG: hypothetical protein Q9208_006645 [Pyrenodesmia sp. 3 TL-2023]